MKGRESIRFPFFLLSDLRSLKFSEDDARALFGKLRINFSPWFYRNKKTSHKVRFT
jgi:hypothetical protein